MRLNKQIFGWLGVSALLLTASCSNEQTLNVPDELNSQEVNVYGKGSNLLTFTLGAEGLTGTRDFNGDLSGMHLSDGSLADMLIFAVYTINPDYDEDSPNPFTPKWIVDEEFWKEPGVADKGNITLSNGQNLVKVTNWPLTIQLATDPDKTYKVAFWAQSKDSKAFDTTDLMAVQVKYDADLTKNNDELRDAFCAASQEFIGNSIKEHVILRRPFAQVNVGTSGADYANIMASDNMYPNRVFQHSKIVLVGAADMIDVLNDEIYSSIGFAMNKYTVTFDWAPFASYWQWNVKNDAANLPKRAAAETDGTYKDGKKGFLSLIDFNKYNESQDTKSDYVEEFLKIRLNSEDDSKTLSSIYDLTLDGTFLGYKDLYPTKAKEVDGGHYLTENFKYMSMCYVLVPATAVSEDQKDHGNTDINEDDFQDGKYYTSSVLSSLEVYFAENADGTDNVYVGEGNGDDNSGYTKKDSRAYLRLTNVPVQRNWRTNIIGGLSDTDYEDGPDDPTSLFNTKLICIHRDPIFFNEYTGIYPPEIEWMSNEVDYDSTWEDFHQTPAADPDPDSSDTNPGQPAD